MATQPVTTTDEPLPSAADNDDTTPPERDYEAEARLQGWRPKEEFPGDQNRWVDAETFVKRADEVMPLLKAQNKQLHRKVSDLERDIKRFSKFAGAAEERIRAEIEAEMKKAVETGDTKAFDAARKKEQDLDKSDGKTKFTVEDLDSAFETFRDDNPWYDRGGLASGTEVDRDARIYAERQLEKRLKNIKPGEEPPPDELFAEIKAAVEEKFPALNARPLRQKPASDVAGGGTPRGRTTGRTWDALPDDAKRQYQRFIDKGLLGVKATGDADKDAAAARAYYAKNHDWSV